ncbi:hypothetical protein [Haloferula sp. BvORR071]|uniref:hypothetical protein n=1 Tax=Haloferula sp. BvORR071 TaxID=1396141 RepID=UPI0005590C25|nr:hypothetical protein [Haloferula sp. BvORR071]
MYPSHYEDYKRALAMGDRAGAASLVVAFIASFRSMEEKAEWARWFLENENNGHRIRHELYRDLIFPVLLDGYTKRDPWSIKWLARTAQSLYRDRSLHEQSGWKTEMGLLMELVELCPDDGEARSKLLSVVLDWLKYSGHEWPAGLLYGSNAATLEECVDIEAQLELARRLDEGRSNEEFLEGFAVKLREYQERLRRRSS